MQKELIYYTCLAVLPRDQRGPFCFTCDGVDSPDNCTEVTLCHRDEVVNKYPLCVLVFVLLSYKTGLNT